VRFEDWFLTAAERGNAATRIDRRRGRDADAWTEGNLVEVLVDGEEYFRHLHAALAATATGDSVFLADWQSDGDERLVGADSEIGKVLASAAQRGVHVRGLLWRSHPRQAHFAEQENLAVAKMVNAAGGQVVLDERVRRGGSHHQKLVVIRRASHPGSDIAFEGGVDLCHGRHDGSDHRGDPQPIGLDRRYGPRPPWHDAQLAVRGPAIGDLEHTFRERWEEPTPLDHHNPLRLAARRLSGEPRHPDPLPGPGPDPAPIGPHAVQVLRTYPAKRPSYPFAPVGERSVARAYLKAFRRARRLVYLEDQYLWSEDAARALAEALSRQQELQVVVVVPRYPDRGGRATSAANRVGRERATKILSDAGPGRVAVYDIENDDGTPIYVHAKICVIDDVLLIAGSDNLNRRSWTHDSEISCSVLDTTPDERSPIDPGGLGDGARRLARETRLRLWREHLGRVEDAEVDAAELIDPATGFNTLARSAAALDRWYRGGRTGPRPPGRLRPHTPERVSAWARPLATALYRSLLDPDGRPRHLRRTDSM
jgi:phosphatidylserine/phosphatidylglycerophosphate/cardiolipin synthase-like enzyme